MLRPSINYLAVLLAVTAAHPLGKLGSLLPSLSYRSNWQPSAGASWQIILRGIMVIDDASPSVTPDVDVFDIDMFMHANLSVISDLHTLNKGVICYFSAGSYEPNRPDSDQFPQEALGKELVGWPGEFWLDLRSQAVRDIMVARIQLASEIGCDGIDPDNVDGFVNENGLNLTKADAIDFVQFLAAEAAKYGMAVGLKNALDVIPEVLDVIDFAVNEQCAEYGECTKYQSMVEAGKPVFQIEYTDTNPNDPTPSETDSSLETRADVTLEPIVCVNTTTYTGFSTVLKTFALDGLVTYCDNTTYVTETRSQDDNDEPEA